MKNITINTTLFFSIILTLLCPILGIIPLYYSIKGLNTKNIALIKKADKWVKYITIFILFIWILLVPLFYFLFEMSI